MYICYMYERMYRAVIKPYLFDATVAPYNVRLELTPTDHAAVLRVTFPATFGKYVQFYYFLILCHYTKTKDIILKF